MTTLLFFSVHRLDRRLQSIRGVQKLLQIRSIHQTPANFLYHILYRPHSNAIYASYKIPIVCQSHGAFLSCSTQPVLSQKTVTTRCHIFSKLPDKLWIIETLFWQYIPMFSFTSSLSQLSLFQRSLFGNHFQCGGAHICPWSKLRIKILNSIMHLFYSKSIFKTVQKISGYILHPLDIYKA